MVGDFHPLGRADHGGERLERRIRRGVSLHHRIDGPEDGTPLVLVNGLFADLNSWDPAMAHLEGFRVLRYDGRGQGRSGSPDGVCHMDCLVADLEAVLEATAFPPAHCVGISNGGCIALAFAARSPERVLRLVAADCYDRVTPLLRLKIRSWLSAHESGGPLHRFDVAAPWVWSEATLSQNPGALDFYRQKAAEHEDRAVRGLLTGALDHDIDVGAIGCETLVLAGEEDLLTPPFAMRAMAGLIPKGRFRVVPGAHASLLEHPEIFRNPILPFLRGGHDVG